MRVANRASKSCATFVGSPLAFDLLSSDERRLEFLDDDLGFVHPGLFSQSFKLSQTGAFVVRLSFLPCETRRRMLAYEFSRKNLFGRGLNLKLKADSTRAYKRNPHVECLPWPAQSGVIRPSRVSA